MATTFKSYSEKSKARRALVQVYSIDKEHTDAFLTQEDAKWGFSLDSDNIPVPLPTVGVEAPPAATLTPQADEGAALAALVVAQDTPEQDETPAASASAFGAFAMSQLTAPSNTAPVEPQRTSTSQRVAGLKIEKNREERNGVKMPSVGGMCRAVWDALNSLMTHDEASGTASVPTVADIKKLAEEKGWNVNNASIEYYQWRKWHGITGRGKKTI